MKWSQIVHGISSIAGIIGILTLIAAWVAGSGTLFGFSQAHFFEDTKALLLVSIAFGIMTLIHQNEEKNKSTFCKFKVENKTL